MTLKGKCANPKWTGEKGIIEYTVDKIEKDAVYPIERDKCYNLAQTILRTFAYFYTNEQVGEILDTIRRSNDLRQ